MLGGGGFGAGLGTSLGLGDFLGIGATLSRQQGPPGPFGPEDPFLEDDWKADRKEALRRAALAAGMNLLGTAGQGQWANLGGGIQAGAQGYAQNVAQQRQEAERRREVEWELGQRKTKAAREAWDKALERSREIRTEKEQVEDHARKVSELPLSHRKLLAPFVGESNFEEQYVRVLRELDKEEDHGEDRDMPPRTTGLPKGYMWEGDRAVRVPGIPERARGGGAEETEVPPPSETERWELLMDEVRHRYGMLPAEHRVPGARAEVVKSVRTELERAGVDYSFLDKKEPEDGADEAEGEDETAPEVPLIVGRWVQSLELPVAPPKQALIARQVAEQLLKAETKEERLAVFQAAEAELRKLGLLRPAASGGAGSTGGIRVPSAPEWNAPHG